MKRSDFLKFLALAPLAAKKLLEIKPGDDIAKDYKVVATPEYRPTESFAKEYQVKGRDIREPFPSFPVVLIKGQMTHLGPYLGAVDRIEELNDLYPYKLCEGAQCICLNQGSYKVNVYNKGQWILAGDFNNFF